MRLVVVAIAAFASLVYAVDQCTLATSNPEKTAFLERIKALNGKNYSVVSGNSTYSLKWCGDVSTQQSKATVVRVEGKLEHVIGRYNETDIITFGGWNIVTFAGGELINSSDHCNGTQWKAVILLECHPGTVENLTLIDSMNAGCFAVFHLNTSAVCPIGPTPPPPLPEKPTSRWTVFFMLLFTAGVCYLVIGMAYRRFVLGAQGLEQVPNYDFWRDPCGYTRDYCNQRDMQHNEPWSNSSRVNDNVDEPLLRP